jgi:RNA polymerase sigma factor (TIGR02999 family)
METSASRKDAAAFIERHYDTLKVMARSRRRRAQSPQGMLTTDILHEAWLKISDRNGWNDEIHFFASAAQAMRSVIVDHARAMLAQKRGGGGRHEVLDELQDILADPSETPEDLVSISTLIDSLETEYPRVAKVVVLRYFGGFTDGEVAAILGVSDRTIRSDWGFAKAWIAEAIEWELPTALK